MDTVLRPRGSARPGRALPAWSSVLAVVAHPDDESFGLGAVITALVRRGAAVHVLCYTHGEASTLNETCADLHRARESELRQAGVELGVASVTLLNYPDGRLAGTGPAELAAHAAAAAASRGASGLLVFDDTGITGHPDHQAATAAAVRAARQAGLPVLAWALPDAVAGPHSGLRRALSAHQGIDRRLLALRCPHWPRHLLRAADAEPAEFRGDQCNGVETVRILRAARSADRPALSPRLPLVRWPAGPPGPGRRRRSSPL